MDSLKSLFGDTSKAKHLILFYISGGIGTFFFWLLYQQMLTLPMLDGSQSWAWTLSYVCSILWQHALHRYLVFGAQSPYLQSMLSLSCFSLTPRSDVYLRIIWGQFSSVAFLYDWFGKSWNCMFVLSHRARIYFPGRNFSICYQFIGHRSDQLLYAKQSFQLEIERFCGLVKFVRLFVILLGLQ
jgi:putative flippase GtrA